MKEMKENKRLCNREGNVKREMKENERLCKYRFANALLQRSLHVIKISYEITNDWFRLGLG